MKQIKFKVYNYGQISVIADFKSNEHDAFKTLGFFNAEIAASHNGKLPINTFYFLEYRSKRTNVLKVMIHTNPSFDDLAHRKNVNEIYKAIGEPTLY